jgi:O-antigen/teichoic acid export membrane protein
MQVSEAALITARCVRNNLLIAVITCGVLFVFARPIIALLYGGSFLPVVPAFDVLLVGVVVLSLGSPVSSYFTLKLGQPQVALWLSLGSAIICLGATAALVHRYGMLGAAFGSTLGYLIGQSAGLWYFCRVARLHPVMILVPTMQDLAVYAAFAAQLVKDGRRLLRPVH